MTEKLFTILRILCSFLFGFLVFRFSALSEYPASPFSSSALLFFCFLLDVLQD